VIISVYQESPVARLISGILCRSINDTETEKQGKVILKKNK
jgi:hypothetical protein